ncbi:hypothetical protein ACHAWF_004858 [Thalassiosira exigua]
MQLCTCFPCLEETGSELCFIKHPVFDSSMKCDIFGRIWMDSNWNAGWKVWRFTRIDDGQHFIITSWTHSHKVLSSNKDGRVFTTENKDGDSEKWRISSHPTQHGVRIQSVVHGGFLAFSGHEVCTKDEEEDTTWHLEPAHGNNFFISKASLDKRLSSSDEQPFIHRNRKAWERWAIQAVNETGHFAIHSQKHGKYLCSTEDGVLAVGESRQLWEIYISPHGGFFIQSVEHGRKLSCDDQGHLFTAETSGEEESWNLEPIMPWTISGRQIWTMVGVGVTIIVTSVAVPFAVVGIVGAVGFGAEGIVAGSMAAGMMSAEAIASGGGVIAGGTVATLQSIGAAGLGAAGASAAAGAGAVAGGLTSLGVAAASNGSETNQDTVTIEEPHAPLCSWRTWE